MWKRNKYFVWESDATFKYASCFETTYNRLCVQKKLLEKISFFLLEILYVREEW